MPRIEASRIAFKALAVSVEDPLLGSLGPSSEISMRMVWSGNSGSQLSIWDRG